MRAWRLCKEAHARALDGEGNRRTGARWNSPGRPVLYCSEVLSLAVVETLVHTTHRHMPRDLASVLLELPDDAPVTRVEIAEFPKGWQRGEQDPWFRSRGDRWLAEAKSLCLLAPSVVVPEDHNMMLNPFHPGMRRVAVRQVRRFRFDPRLVR